MVKESSAKLNNNSAYKTNTSTIHKLQQPKVINCLRDSSKNPEEYLKDCCIGKIVPNGSTRKIKCDTASYFMHLNNDNKEKYTYYYNEFLDKMKNDRVYAKQQMGDYFTKPIEEQQRLLEEDKDYYERVDGGKKRRKKRKTRKNKNNKRKRKTRRYYY